MNLQDQDLARTMANARIASARERQLARQVMRSRRLARRADRERSPRRGLVRLLSVTTVDRFLASMRRPRRLRHSDVRAPAIAFTSPRDPRVSAGVRQRPTSATAELAALLDVVAQQVVESGTVRAARLLEELSAAAMHDRPGAAAALVDWNGSEIARLRAFGIVHGVVLGALGPHHQAALLTRLRGDTALPLAG